MSPLSILFIILCSALLLISAFLFLQNRKLHRDVDALSESIERFISNGEHIPFSTSDDRFSRLQNCVSDLESLYRLEKSNTEREGRRNTQFISDVSHQLKTPVAALRLYIEMDGQAHPNDHTEKELELIEKMEQLIFNLIRLEKLRSDAYTMNFERQELCAIAETVIGEFRPLFPDKTFSVSGSSVMRVDRQWLGEALSNIVKNACEHTPDDGIISVEISDSEKSSVIIISDNGGGVNAEELPLLFARFHRTANAHPNSAGIGLAISKAIVEKHHGTISAENAGGGLKIIICLPHIDGREAI